MFLLETNQDGKIVSYLPVANLDLIPEGGILKTEEEVEVIMKKGIAWIIDSEIVYPPKKDQVYQDNQWIYPDEYFEKLSFSLKQELVRLCDKKQDDILQLFLKEKATEGQQKRYKRMYERALAGEFEPDERAAIIKKHEFVIKQIDAFVDMIEFARKSVNTMIEASEYDRAKEKISLLKQLDESVTPQYLQTLLT